MKRETLMRLTAVVLFIQSVGCISLLNKKNDPFYESFYEKTRLIMTSAEVKVYKLLTEAEDKEEFIREFWKIRDPDPATEENEAKTEFEERVLYACRWFSFNREQKWREDYEPSKKDRGWDTYMGRIFIVLGHPDIILLGDGSIQGGSDLDRRFISGFGIERWYYNKWNLWLEFSGTSLDYRQAASPQLFDAIESTKMNMVSPETRVDLDKSLRFDTVYEKGALIILVPTTRVIFKEEGQTLHAKFRIRVYIYRNRKKIDTIETEKVLSGQDADFLEKRHLRLDIPYPLYQKGEYGFDVLMQDLNSTVYSKYRDFIKTHI